MIRTLISRIAWYGMAALLAVVAYGVEIDRQSRNDADLAVMVPAYFRAFSQQRIVAGLIEASASAGQANTTGQALTEARRLVRSRPIPGENLYLLAVATSLSGDQNAGLQIMGLSGERGWRVPLIQQSMIDFALYNNAIDIAAARLLAISSIADSDEDRKVLKLAFAKVFKMPGGPEALGKVLATSSFSQTRGLRDAWSMATPDQFARMTRAALLAGARFDCDTLESHIQSLKTRGQNGAAQVIAKPVARRCR